MNKTLLLAKAHMCNTLGINELRFGHNHKKARQTRMFIILYAILAIVAVAWWGGICGAFVSLGFGDLIPLVSCVVVSAIVLIIDIFYAGYSVFNAKGYEREISLPVTPFNIVASRLIALFAVDLIISLLVFITGCVVIGQPLYWVQGIIGAVFTPMIPMAVSLALGCLIGIATARMPHKNIASTVISVLFTLVILVFVFTQNSLQDEFFNTVAEVFSGISVQMQNMYPPGALFASGEPVLVGLFVLISVAVYALFVALAVWKYAPICSALNTHYTKHTYKMQNLSSVSQGKALFKQDLKRYTSSSVYMSNTIMGYIIAIVFAVILCIIGPGAMGNVFGDENILMSLAPFLLALFASLSPLTGACISIEGKNLWIKQSLPVPTKKVLNSKLLLHLVISVPCLLAAAAIMAFGLNPPGLDKAALVIAPLVFTLYAGVLGLFQDLRSPNLSWETEVQAVKQGKSVAFTMLFTFVPALVLAGVIAVAGAFVGCIIVCAILLVISFVLYKMCMKFDVSRLE